MIDADPSTPWAAPTRLAGRKHHLSFADYRDSGHMNWAALRVWNDDGIAPNTGFPPHPHADMEVITYVREGAITQSDSLGSTGRAAFSCPPPARWK